MEIVTILRVLRRHRVLVALGCVPALLVGLMLVYRVSFLPPQLGSRATVSGVASGRALLDAREQPNARFQAAINDTLGTRALLLADLMAARSAHESIAAAAGVKPEELAIMGPSTGAPHVAIPLAVRATEAAALSPASYRLVVDANAAVPIITLRASAPDADAAVRLVDAGSAALGDLVAGIDPGKETSPLALEPLGPAVGGTRVDRPKAAVGLLAALIVWLAWCAGVTALAGVARQWRATRPPPARRPLPG